MYKRQGLRGAVPIIFATYPVVANVPGAHVIFNIVFFITIVSRVIQGTTVSWVCLLYTSDVFFGVLPKYDSKRTKLTFTVKQNYLPWSLQIKQSR